MRRFLWEGSIQRVKTTSSKELLEFQTWGSTAVKDCSAFAGFEKRSGCIVQTVGFLFMLSMLLIPVL